MSSFSSIYQYINEDKIVPNTDNFMIFAILHFYNFILVINTTVQNNNNEISLHFKPMGLIFMNYSVLLTYSMEQSPS